MKAFLSILFAFGMVCVLLSAAVYITRWPFAPYCYLVGALVAAFAQIAMQPRRGGVMLRRLYRQQAFGALFLVAAGVCMLYTHGNEWMVCMLIASVLELYTAFRIPVEERKEQRG